MTLRQGGRSLQQKGAFTSARVAANEHHRAWHKAASKHPVQLGESGTNPFGVYRFNITESFHVGGYACITHSGRGHRSDVDPTEGIPRATGTALALPLAVLGTTFIAYVGGFSFCFCHKESEQLDAMAHSRCTSRGLNPRTW